MAPSLHRLGTVANVAVAAVHIKESTKEDQRKKCDDALKGLPATPSKNGWRRATRNEDKMQVEEEMWHLPIFAQCHEEFHKALAERVRIKVFPQGQTIVEHGAPSDSILIVRRGAAQVFVGDMQVERIQSGHYIGETALLGMEQQWSVTLRAEKLCTIETLSREDFLGVLQGFPDEERFFTQMTEANMAVLEDGTLVDTCEMFRDLSEATLLTIDKRIIRRLYFPGETLLVQGDPVGEMFIMVRGQVNIEINGRTVRSEARGVEMKDTPRGSRASLLRLQTKESLWMKKPRQHLTPRCFGEQGLLGLTTVRTATVRVAQIAHVRVLHRPVFQKILEEHSEYLRMGEFAKKVLIV
jgi:CRP-like cAMP-binding protein